MSTRRRRKSRRAPRRNRRTETPTEPNTEADVAGFEALLEYIQRSRGFDFTGYKRSSLMRRVRKRMQMVGVEATSPPTSTTWRSTPRSSPLLFDTILINVTAFFRDPAAWEYARRRGRPPDPGRASAPDEPIRVWSAGCASGEEAYTPGDRPGRGAGPRRLPRAGQDLRHRRRRGGPRPAPGWRSTTPRRSKASPPRCWRSTSSRSAHRFGVPQGPAPVGDLRPPRPDPGRADLADRPAGLPQHADVLQHRDPGADPRPVPLRAGRPRLPVPRQGRDPADVQQHVRPGRPEAADLRQGRHGATSATGSWRSPGSATGRPSTTWSTTSGSARRPSRPCPVAQLVVDSDGLLVLANERARALFRLDPADLGRPLQDLEISYRPVELRSCIDRAYAERQAGRPSATSSGRPSRRRASGYLDVHVVPLLDRRRDAARGQHHLHRRHRQPQAPGRAPGLQPRAGDRLRGAPVDQRGAGDHQRGAPVHHRGAGDHQRGAPVDQRRAGDDERGAPVDQRGARDGQRGAARAERRAERGQRLPRVDPREPARRRGRRRPRTCSSRSGTTGPRTSGASAPTRSAASTC